LTFDLLPYYASVLTNSFVNATLYFRFQKKNNERVRLLRFVCKPLTGLLGGDCQMNQMIDRWFLCGGMRMYGVGLIDAKFKISLLGKLKNDKGTE